MKHSLIVTLHFRLSLSMIEIAIVDECAHSRASFASYIEEFIHSLGQRSLLLTPISILPLSPEELSFRRSPSLIILLAHAHHTFPQVKKTLDQASCPPLLLVQIMPHKSVPEQVERFIRLGASDTFEGDMAISFLLKHLIDLEQRSTRSKGTLHLVDSGKGGVGCTSLVASLGSLLGNGDLSAVVVDTDVFSRDLSRILRVTPLLNDALDRIISGLPITSESIEETLFRSPLSPSLFVVPPTASLQTFEPHRGDSTRTFVHYCDLLSRHYDHVFVDCSPLPEEILMLLSRKASSYTHIVDRDPYSLPGAIERWRRLSLDVSPIPKLTLIVNDSRSTRFSEKLILEEFRSLTGVSSERAPSFRIPYNSEARAPSSTLMTLAMSRAPALRSSFIALRDRYIPETEAIAPSSFVRTPLRARLHAFSEAVTPWMSRGRSLLRLPGSSRQIATSSQSTHLPALIASPEAPAHIQSSL
jgi:MinD-like ATPase involved in chromosome partitioning or flagellar assembly